MARSINFVQDRQKRRSVVEDKDKQFLVKSGMILGATVTLLLLAVGVRLFFQMNLDKNLNKQEEVRQSILSRKQFEITYLVFAHKLEELTELFDKRKNKQEAIAYFAQVFGSDVVISQITYSADNDEISLGLTAESVFVLNRVFETLQSEALKKEYPEVRKNDLRRAQDGTYIMDLTVPLKTILES